MNSQDTGQVTIHEGLGVPVEAIDHIEVMLGAGSVIYGSNAMTAVIHVFTRTPGEEAIVRVTAGLQVAPPIDTDGDPTVPDGPGERAGFRYRFGAGALVPFRWLGSDAVLTIEAVWIDDLSNSYATPVFDASAEDSGWNVYAGDTTWGGTAHHTMQAPSVLASLRIGDFRLRAMANYYYHNMPFNGRFADPLSREERYAARIDLTHSAYVTPEANLSTRPYADFTHWGERTSWSLPYFCFEGQVDGCRFERSSPGRSAGLEQILTVDWDLDTV
jgi:outer membrane receptor protein involved in Fe transport